MEKSFSIDIRMTMHKYNIDPNAGKAHSVAALHAQVEDLKNVMGQNIYILLQRGENLESIVDRAGSLEQMANVFKKRTKRVHNEMKTKSIKYKLCIGFTVFMVCYIVGASFCGVYYQHCIDWHRPR